MKKLVFMFVAMAAISFASCGNKAEANVENDTTAQDTVVADSTVDSTAVADSTVAE